MEIVSLELQHFKNHTYASFHFKNTNHFFGDNFTGKTSIGDAIVFALYGVTKHGFKTYVHDFIQAGKNSMSVKITIQLNNELLEIKRSIHGNKETLLLNNNKITQKQLSQFIGDHTLFIYSFSLMYFLKRIKKQPVNFFSRCCLIKRYFCSADQRTRTIQRAIVKISLLYTKKTSNIIRFSVFFPVKVSDIIRTI